MLKMIHDRMLVKVDREPDKTVTGLIKLRESVPMECGTVISSGRGRVHPKGWLEKTYAKPGEVVYYSKGVATKIEFEGEKYDIIDNKMVLAVDRRK